MKANLTEFLANGPRRWQELDALGYTSADIQSLIAQGRVERLSRGLYMLAGQALDENISLLEVSLKAPKAVIALTSALRFHNIGTQLPWQVDIALPTGAWSPKFDYPPVNVTHMNAATYAYGIEEHAVSGGVVKVYGVAKTLADCFKFRNRVGLDVCLEAMRDILRQRSASIDVIWAAAKVCRVNNVMRPYLEAMNY